MATHSSTLAWEIPWTDEPGRLQSMGSLRVGHDWATSHSLFTLMQWRRKRQPTRVLAWRIPGTEEPGRPPSLGSHWVRHDRSDLAAAAAAAVPLIMHPCGTAYLYILGKVRRQIKTYPISISQTASIPNEGNSNCFHQVGGRLNVNVMYLGYCFLYYKAIYNFK